MVRLALIGLALLTAATGFGQDAAVTCYALPGAPGRGMERRLGPEEEAVAVAATQVPPALWTNARFWAVDRPEE